MLKRRREGEKRFEQTMFERSFWRFFSRIGDLFILTLFWTLTSLPLVTIGASTTALFYVCLKIHNHEEGTLWQMYKKSFCANIKQGTFIWLLYVFVALDAMIVGHTLCRAGVLAAADFSAGGRYYAALVLACSIFAGIVIYTAALLAMFRQSTAQCISAAIGLTFSQLPSTILYLFILLALFLITCCLFPALIFIDVPLAVYLISMRMNVIFQKQIARTEARNKAA